MSLLVWLLLARQPGPYVEPIYLPCKTCFHTAAPRLHEPRGPRR